MINDDDACGKLLFNSWEILFMTSIPIERFELMRINAMDFFVGLFSIN